MVASDGVLKVKRQLKYGQKTRSVQEAPGTGQALAPSPGDGDWLVSQALCCRYRLGLRFVPANPETFRVTVAPAKQEFCAACQAAPGNKSRRLLCSAGQPVKFGVDAI